ncbi:anthrone oxygenase family protein [uncultured Sulfitobacter sp.]|uniref:anthrone oxygenase family protein n=1 Tax=uncultured Sulfitobacter sp. TaxID=191468 RepID=UPI002619FC68|nr:anthrone oxygenase family protein [uncultured Sulfitobacter sp.]
MSPEFNLVFVQVSVVAYALVAGVFLTFSDFVMTSLAKADPAGAIQTMQIINREVFRTIFMVLLLGMSAVSPMIVVYAIGTDIGYAQNWIVAAGALYFLGTFIVTLVFNVPMNNRLDRMQFNSAEAAAYWLRYVPAWRFWNWVRTIAAALASLCLLIATVIMAQS